MSTIQRLETTFGVLAVVWGTLCLVFVFFGPLYHSSSGGTASIVQDGLSPITLIFFTILFLALLGIAIGAAIHSRRGGIGWGLLLWISTGIAGAIIVLTILSVGIFFFPSVLLALLACALSLSQFIQRHFSPAYEPQTRE